MNNILSESEKFISENKALVNSQYRLKYHLMGEMGWINDPNGFVFFNGEYHLFYQHYPYDSVWGPMHWGHATSKDLITWEYQPIALAPDMPYDKDGCFSGSAIEKDGKLYLLYTGHVVNQLVKGNVVVQQQCVAVSDDAIKFNKILENPVLQTVDIPEDSNKSDFRDPKVTKIGNEYFMVIGSNDGKGNGQVLLYTSHDLVKWSFRNVLAKSDGNLGANWECPDLFPLQNKFILIISPQEVDPKKYLNSNTSLCLVGDFNSISGTFHKQQEVRMDYGFDFYAPQSMEDELGRRIIIGWMNTWGNENPTQTHKHGWAGSMTLPREMIIKNDKLLFKPVKEIEHYRHNEYTMEFTDIQEEVTLPISGESYELILDIEPGGADEVGLKVRVGDDEETLLYYIPSEETFLFDRNKSGIGPKGIAHANVKMNKGRLSLRIFVDRSSVEVFIGDGEVVMTGQIFPSSDSTGIALFSKGTAILHSFQKWDL